MKTKLNLIILCLLLFLAGGGNVSLAASWSYPEDEPKTPFGGGTGTQSDPYRISTAQHLANLSWMVNDGENYEGEYFVMTNDITLNEDVINSTGNGLKKTQDKYTLWTPMGKSGWIQDEFSGTFDGCGHTIKGIVCISGEAIYQGLFGIIQYATVKNLNITDSYILNTQYTKEDGACGVLTGRIKNSNILNCHVSQSVIKLDYLLGAGGLVGAAHNKGSVWLDPSYIRRCSFSGKIILDANHDSMFAQGYKYKVGGILGCDGSALSTYIEDCCTEGEIIAGQKKNIDGIWVAGIVGGDAGYCVIYRCISRMNITVKPNCEISQAYVKGIRAEGQTATQCASLGTITIGTSEQKAGIEDLIVAGIGGTFPEGCAFYGKFEIHAHGDDAKIAALTNVYYTDYNNRPSVVYSVGNIIDLTYDDAEIDQICNKSRHDSHKDYYHFERADGVPIDCKYTENISTYNKTLTQLKADNFITELNKIAGKLVWGKLTEWTENLNGLPLQIVCGGMVTSYAGEGTATSPYIISSEAELKSLMTTVNGGNDLKDKYFRLGADIYMTGFMDYSIGFYKDKPFKGHLDGNGHAIIGLRNQLFGYMCGTVKNLAIIDCYIKSQGWTGAIAGSVGDENNKAEVSNCYVSGLVQASGSTQILLGGICGNVASGSSVHDSYFKGHLIVESGYNSSGGSHYVGGISGYNGGTVDTTTPQGIYNCYASFKYQKVTTGISSSCYLYGISNGGVKDCYVVTSATMDINNQGCTKLNSESELNGKFDGKAGWLQGVYRPLLASAKHYEAKSPEGTDAYFDAIPEENHKKNYFYNISIDDPYSDVSLWNLPNMAIYVPSDRMDYITNGYLDQSADFQYKRTAEATATAGQLRYDLKQTEKGYHMVCLPGNVERDDLPKDAKVMIIGTIQKGDNGKEEVNVVMVDTIPAGVPCMLYVPISSVAKDEKISLVMRSGIVSTPTVNTTYSNFNGTFSNKELTAEACTTAKYSGDNNTLPCFVRNTETTTAKPFSAWLEGATGDNVQIVDYVLLDEENETMTLTLAGLHSTAEAKKETNVKMRRTIKTGKWNTVCLPFDMTAKEIDETFGDNTKVEIFGGLKYDATAKSTTLQFSAATADTEGGAIIKAGTPYLLKPGKTTDISISEIKGKEITCASVDYVPTGIMQDATTTGGSVSLTMQGEYNHRMITPDEATDGKSLYVISGDNIYYVNSDVEMKGFRCYFVAEESAAGSTAEGASLFSRAKVMHADGTSTDLRLIKADATDEGDAVYDLLGRKRDEQTKGTVIVNGKKIIIK